MAKKLIVLLSVCAFCLACLLDERVGAGESKSGKALTFARNIAPILQKNCQECHRTGGIAPMSLVTYEEVRPWARSIKEQVVKRQMPPFHASGEIGYFRDDPRLTDQEIAAISTWVDSGAPKGNLKDAPPPRDWPANWKFGKPDLILSVRQPFIVHPNTEDNYQLFVTDHLFTEDTWIRGLDIRPGNLRVVHHASLYTVPDSYISKVGPDGRVEGADLFVRGGQLFGNWVPGATARYYEPGYGALIRKGTRFAIQVHYAPTGQQEIDQTAIGFYFSDGKIHKQNHMLYGGSDNIEIPPGAEAHRIIQRRKFKTDALVKAFTAHMHLRGKSFTIRLLYPNGKEETVFEVPRFNFNWQRFYKLAKPLSVPAGTVAEFIAVWDNSSKNPFNPDPKATVYFGEKTSDEMMSGNIQYEIPGEELNLIVRNGRVVN